MVCLWDESARTNTLTGFQNSSWKCLHAFLPNNNEFCQPIRPFKEGLRSDLSLWYGLWSHGSSFSLLKSDWSQSLAVSPSSTMQTIYFLVNLVLHGASMSIQSFFSSPNFSIALSSWLFVSPWFYTWSLYNLPSLHHNLTIMLNSIPHPMNVTNMLDRMGYVQVVSSILLNTLIITRNDQLYEWITNTIGYVHHCDGGLKNRSGCRASCSEIINCASCR